MTTSSMSSSSTPSVELGFSKQDIQVARAVVRLLVKNGVRKGPSELLVMEDYVLDRWWTEEAIEFLKEQKAARQACIAVIE